MAKKELKIFGAFRTGSNLVRSLLELNFDVLVHNNNFAYKHIPVPADFKDNQYLPLPFGLISTVKDPFAFLDSTFRYCKQNNFLNVEAGQTFDEFCYQRFIVFDGGFENFPRYRFSNPIQYWNSVNHNLLSLPDRHNYVLRYEDLLENMAGEIRKIGKKYKLRRNKGKFVLPTGVTINLGDPQRASPDDYFQDLEFERKAYYLERQYMERFTVAQRDFIYSELDQDLMQALSYPQSSSIMENQANKTSFVGDLRQLVRLGEERIPQLEASLATERDASLKASQQLEQSRGKILDLESHILKETLDRESTVNKLVKELQEEKAARVAETNALLRKTEDLEGQLTDVSKGLETSKKKLEITEAEFEKNRQKQLGLENELGQLEVKIKQNKDELDRARTNYYGIRDSFSFKLGYDMVHALARPGKNTLLFPFRVFRNLKSAYAGSKASGNEKIARSMVSDAAEQLEHSEAEPVESIKQAAEITVACIFDEFTTAGYQGECNLLPVPVDGWLELFSETKPDLLFVESAWRGNGGQWEYKIGKYAGQDGSELGSLLKWCKTYGVPTVFWNKEDPVHYDKFIDSAKQFDVIFTTDDGRIPGYREAVGHENIFSLQFSAQPSLHNPIKTIEVHDKICFAGSYYLNLHETRRQEMNEILDIAKTYGLVIYDRNYERNLESDTEFSFPERFREDIVGSLKYTEMDRAYKGYKYCLNVNSIKNSKTMFSRRVFESMACGTPVLSTWSKGIEETFGDLILMTGRKFDADQILARLHDDKDAYRKMALQGIRDVYSHHLYKHRFATILEKAGIEVVHESSYSVTMICIASHAKEAERAISQFNTQILEQKALLLLLDFNTGLENILNDPGNQQENMAIFHLDSALALGYSMHELVKTTHVAFIEQMNHYGRHFLTDLVHAAIYTDAQVIGKASYFMLEGETLQISDGEEYSFTDSIFSTSSIVDFSLIRDRGLQDVMEFFRTDQKAGGLLEDTVRCFSADRFNFIEAAYSKEFDGLNAIIEQVDI